MSDLKLNWDNDLMSGDLGWGSGDLEPEDGLTTAVYISLFTDRRAADDDEIDNPEDPRGWWGDQLSEIPGDQIGSRLWLLDRSKTDRDTLLRAEEYAYEALEWMIEDNVASEITVTAFRNTLINPVTKNRVEVLGLVIVITKLEGTEESFVFDNLWDAQLAAQ
jgi:phage gp46-like protein